MKKYKGKNVTATRYNWVLVANDDAMMYQIYHSKTNELVFENEAEDTCLELLFKLTGTFESYDESLIKNWNLGE